MARLSISLLGSFQVALDGRPVTTFESDRVRALLTYLAVESDRPHSRSELASLLWPDHDEEAARTNLRHVLRKLREAIRDDAAPPSFLLVTHQTLQLNSEANIELDVAAFTQHIAAYEAHTSEHEAPNSCPLCIDRLTQAMALYGGPFLAGFSFARSAPFEEWARTTQEQLHRQALEALHQLTAYHERKGDYATAARFASWQVKLEPWREDAHAQWMRALALSGQREAALLQYETCCRVLAQELSLAPSDGLRELAERIRSGEFGRGVEEQEGVSAPPLNLPAQLTAFVGRERELSNIVSQLERADVRLFTLVGPGGIGKTRLAIEAARTRLNACPDGVFFVSLAPLASPLAIAPAIVSALGMSVRGDPKEALLQFLRNKRLMLVLDNFEHLLSGIEHSEHSEHSEPSEVDPAGTLKALSAVSLRSVEGRTVSDKGRDGTAVVADILHAAPHVQIVVTSRERLNVHGEQVYVVPGMDYPGHDAPLSQTDWVAGMSSAAVRLFVQSARRVQPDFQLDEGNWSLVARICDLVQGMPLALELASAWTEMLPLDAIAHEIEKSADFLAYDWRDVPERQRSMRAVFDWSWRLLSEAEQQVVRRLSVFQGGFTREAAELVAGASLRALAGLVHKSLVQRNEAGRYEIHELLRQFAAERLDAQSSDRTSEREAVEGRHGRYFLDFVVARERRLARDEPRQAAAEIQAELDNVRRAWTWAAERVHLEELNRSACAMWLFYSFVGLASEGARAFGLAVERVRASQAVLTQSSQRVLGKLLACQAYFLISTGKHAQAYSLSQHAVALSQASQGVEGESLGLMVQGQALRRMGQSTEAFSFLERAVALAHRGLHDDVFGEPLNEWMPEIEWRARGWLCSIALNPMHDYGAAQRLAEGILRVCTSLNKLNGQMTGYTDLVDVAMARGDLETAQRHSERVLELARMLQSPWGEMVSCSELASIATLKGDYSTACERFEHILEITRRTGNVTQEAIALTKLGRLNTLLGNTPRAAAWFDQLFHTIPEADMPAGEYLDLLLALGWFARYKTEYESARDYAEQAHKLAQHRVADPAREAESLTIMGHAQAGLMRLSEAKASYEQALTIFDELGDVQSAVEPRAGLAQIVLAERDVVQARVLVEDILKVLADHPRAGLDQPFFAYLTCHHVLTVIGDPRAEAVLQTSQAIVQAYAEHIGDAALRQSFLEHVATHRVLWQAGNTNRPHDERDDACDQHRLHCAHH